MNEIYSSYDITLNKLENRAYKGKILKIEGSSYQETREGYNKLPYPYTNTTKTENGITFTDNGDGTINIKGTSTAETYFYFYSGNIADLDNISELNGKKVVFKEFSNKISDSTVMLSLHNFDNSGKSTYLNKGTVSNSITIDNQSQSVNSAIIVKEGITIDIKIVPMIVLEEIKDVEKFEKYGASPTIEYPSEIKSVGDNIQLFDVKDFVSKNSEYYSLENGSLICIKTSTESNGFDYTPYKAGTYIISVENPCRLRVFEEGNTTPIAQKNDGKELVFTIEEDKNLYFKFFGVADPAKIGKVKIEKGEIKTPYSSYGQGSIEIINSNKNLLNLGNDTFVSNGLNITNEISKITVDGTLETSWATASKPKECLFRAGTYTFSIDKPLTHHIYLNFTFEDGTSRTLQVNRYNLSNQITTDKNIVKYNVGFSGVTNGTTYNEIIYLQLEKGVTATEYIEHQSETRLLYTQQPFRSIGDVKDTFVKKAGVWYEQHNIGNKVFNGTEPFTKSATQDLDRYLVNVAEIIKVNDGTGQNLMSNYFKSGSLKIGYVFQNHNIVAFECAEYGTTSVDEFKAWLAEQYASGIPIYIDFVLETPTLIPCTPEQSTILNDLENIQLYDGINHIYAVNELYPTLTLELYHMMEDYDLYISSDGYFIIPGTDIKFLVNFTESSLPTMPEAVEASVRAAGRDGDYVLNTTYEPIPFEIVCYTQDNLTVTQKKEIESKVNRFLNSIKNKTKRLAFERDDKFYNVKYNSLLTTTNYPAHLKFGIPLKSSESYAKDTFEKVIAGNNSKTSDTVNPVGALITINGPATSPIISLNDYSMEYNMSILEGAKVEIDTSKSTITNVNQDGVRTNVMKFYNHQFPKIENGINTLKVLAGIDDEYNVTVKWNDLKL